jgi:hypothetical protein
LSLLERVALHQTRLRVPGVGLDSRGIALGSRALVLLPSVDRLVAFLAVYTRAHTLDALVPSLRIEIVRSKLGTREIALAFDAGSSDRLDTVADTARLAGGFTFTGTSRHFVQYRDASAPFGYDAHELTATNAALALYHSTFSQVYEVERPIDLRALLLRLAPRPDPTTSLATSKTAPPSNLWVLAEPGLGPSLLTYFSRSRVDAEVGLVEWPAASRLEDAPVRRWLFKVTELAPRLRRLVATTPGLGVFLPARPGVAVEHGYSHAVNLRACPVFDEQGLALIRGGSNGPLVIERLPAFAGLAALQRSEVLPEPAAISGIGNADAGVLGVRVALRLVPSSTLLARVTATFVPSAELGLLRRMAYALGARAIASATMAVTADGAFVTCDEGVEPLPLGAFYTRIHEAIYVPAGLRVSPAVSSETVFSALGAPPQRLLFFRPDGSIVGIERGAFVPLERALLEPARWAPVDAAAWQELEAVELPTVRLESLGLRPLAGAEVT